MGDRSRLRASLRDYHIEALRQIAKNLGIDPPHQPARKTWLVNHLSQEIPKLARSRTFVGSLSQAEQAALAVLLEQGGEGTFSSIAIPLLKAGMVHIDEQLEGRDDIPEFKDVLINLAGKGLIVSSVELLSGAKRRIVVPRRLAIPSEVRKALSATHLPGPVQQSTLPSIVPSTSLRVEIGNVEHFLRQALFLWSELRRHPIRQLKRGGVGKRDTRRLAQTLGLAYETEAEQISQLLDMLWALHLISVDEEGVIRSEENAAVTLFWNGARVGQLREIIQGYAQLETPLGVDEKDFLAIRDYLRGFYRRPPFEIRAKLLDLLAQIGDLGWIPISLVVTLLTDGCAGGLIFPDEISDVLSEDLAWYTLGTRRRVREALRHLELKIAHKIAEELHGLGIVDLGYAPQQPQELRAIKVSDSALPYYGQQPESAARESGKGQVVLQPDFQILAMGPVPLRILATLELCAERENVDASVVSYRITRDTAYEAFRHGESAATLLTVLKEVTASEIPQNVARSLETWEEQYQRILVYRQASVLQFDQPELLEELLRDPTLKGRLHPLSASVAWIGVRDLPLVERELRKKEILVADSRGPEEDLPNSVFWRGEELVSRARLPSLFVMGALSRIAEFHGDRWRVTRRSIQTAISQGLELQEIVALLERVTGEPLPAAWEKRLKSWGKYYGDGQTAEVRLLRLTQPGALEELRRADRRLRRWIVPLPSAQDVAIVDERHWDEAVELLTALGMEIEETHWW